MIKRLKNIDLLSELPFYEELNVLKTNHAFKRYAISYKVELVEKKDRIEQLEGNKSSIKVLFSDLLNETKGSKNQITLKVTLKNISQTEKLNSDQLISIRQQKHQQIIHLASTNLFKKCCTELITRLMNGLAGLLN